MLIVAAGIGEHLPESGFALLVIAGVFPQSFFDDLAGNQRKTNALGE
jgi:hypothetical protein